MHKDELNLDDLLTLFGIIGVLLSIIMMVGTAGALDCDSITTFEAAKKIIIWLIILVISTIGLLKAAKDNEGEYDNL